MALKCSGSFSHPCRPFVSRWRASVPQSRVPCLTESINSEEPLSCLKCVSVMENWFSDIEVDRATSSNSPHVQNLCLRSLLRLCCQFRAVFTLQCFCAGGKPRSSLHAAFLHLCCTGSGALWQTRSVILLRVNTHTHTCARKCSCCGLWAPAAGLESAC